MFKLKYSAIITINNIPIQWIPKIELYYPDLPQFPIMYVHFISNGKRIIACPVSVNYNIHDLECDAQFTVLCNVNPTKFIITDIENEIADRIGLSKKITKQTILDCCKGNEDYEALMSDLWQYIERSYGESIPFGRFYEEIYSIPRFVAAWQPKTGRQSEMRMLYNFMSAFGEELIFPDQWKHLEYYAIPTYEDVRNKQYNDFPRFHKLYKAITKLYTYEFSKTLTIDGIEFKVMPKAWKQNKDDFITNVSAKLYSAGKIDLEDKYYSEKLVDAFNRHAWRAAYFISSLLNIEQTDYRTWEKYFFKNFYDNGLKLKGYSEKVIACFLQQGFGKEEIIPIDTWIETFYRFPLGIESRADFYDEFDSLGKMERMIWLASQSNKTNMKNFFNILWCQRYGVIGNSQLRGINPLACSCCKLNSTCVGLKKFSNKKVYITNTLTPSTFSALPIDISDEITFICLLEEDVPKKVYTKSDSEWILIDEFSGYLMTTNNKLPNNLIKKGTITIDEFIKAI